LRKATHNIALNPKTPQMVLGDVTLRFSNSIVKKVLCVGVAFRVSAGVMLLRHLYL